MNKSFIDWNLSLNVTWLVGKLIRYALNLDNKWGSRYFFIISWIEVEWTKKLSYVECANNIGNANNKQLYFEIFMREKRETKLTGSRSKYQNFPVVTNY